MRILPVVSLIFLCSSALSADLIRVPTDVASLSTAISQAQDGDIIELAAGTYESPGGDGFQILDKNQSFTIRAAEGASVTLSGAGSKRILKMRNVGAGDYSVVFEGITFADGFNSTNGSAAGLSINNGKVTFVDCEFNNNSTTASSTGGGGIIVAQGSVAHFHGCRFNGNTARTEGGGLRVAEGATAYVHDSEFTNNRVDLPDHRNSAAGGGIHVTNSKLVVANSRFTGNRAGCVGGAVYILGSWAEPLSTPAAELTIVNSTFEDNITDPDSSVTCIFTPVGGAVHTEDHATAKIYHSRFRRNLAGIGGAVSQYRTILEIHDSIFEGNRSQGSGISNFGGAIMSNSNDVSDSTTGNGTINRRSSSLTVLDSYFQSVFDTTPNGGYQGGCIFMTGDTFRTYGLAGTPQMGTAAENRSTLDIQRSIFNDCDVVEEFGVAGTGAGGALATELSDVTIADSLFINNDSSGTGGNGSAGAVKASGNTVMTVSRSTFAKNTAFSRGGAFQVFGSELNVDNSQFFDNNVTNGNGSVIWSNPAANFNGTNLPVTGLIRVNVFSNNTTREMVEFDNAAGPPNNLRYNANQFFSNNSTVYSNSLLAPAANLNVAGLNAAFITRNGGVGNWDKSVSNNTELGSKPRLAALVAAPPEILLTHADADPPASGQSFLGFAWSGPGGTTGELFGSGLGECAGVETAGSGVYTLDVDGVTDMATLTDGPVPSATLNASPDVLTGGQSTTLSWSIQGDFLEAVIDNNAGVTNMTASGNASINPPGTGTYRLCAVTEQGGASAEDTVFVDEQPPSIFSDNFDSGTLNAWTSQVP